MSIFHGSSRGRSRSQALPGTQRQRILVYDDDEGAAVAFSTLLSRAGYEVDAVSHFDPALRILETNPVDLLVTDIVVPCGVNGLALARMARMKRSKIKVIYVTGYDVPQSEGERVRTHLAEAGIG